VAAGGAKGARIIGARRRPGGRCHAGVGCRCDRTVHAGGSDYPNDDSDGDDGFSGNFNDEFKDKFNGKHDFDGKRDDPADLTELDH
jgi:hypothetical protein